MAVSRSLLRLLQIRELEEEQSRAALAAASQNLRRLQTKWTAARERAHAGRQLVLDSAKNGNIADRLAGAAEVHCGMRHADLLSARIKVAELQLTASRQRFLIQQTERRQVETLIESQRQQDAAEQARKRQQALDEWHRTRRWILDAKQKH